MADTGHRHRQRMLQQNGKKIALICSAYLISFVLPWIGGTAVRLCPFNLVTGIPCAGCGMGRSFCALSSGELVLAFRWHLLGPFLYLALLLVLGGLLLEVLLGRPLDWPLHRRWPRSGSILALLCLLGAWAVRLAGWWPMP